MVLSDFEYEFPEALIAKAPCRPAEDARLLVVTDSRNQFVHSRIRDLPSLLHSGDVLVVNNTRVIPARIWAKGTAGRRFEILLLQPDGESSRWHCLVRPGKHVHRVEEVSLIDGTKVVIHRSKTGFCVLLPVLDSNALFAWLDGVGEPPIPPYLKRKAVASDRADYQTVFARLTGAVAAPTAGLHFTPTLVERIRLPGCKVVETTLHVGMGTFAPLTAATLESDLFHEERFAVPEATLRVVEEAATSGRQVVCVGTTALRALESVPYFGIRGKTRLFIKPGFPFRYCTALLTNFHQPKSSLLVLVTSILGIEGRRHAYEEAIRMGYRFFSYGDAMWIPIPKISEA